MRIASRLMVDVGENNAERLYRALLPEMKSNKSKAAKVTLGVEGPWLMVNIESSTIAAARALLNSYIRWISISIDILVCR